jgi:hypothetical protein
MDRVWTRCAAAWLLAISVALWHPWAWAAEAGPTVRIDEVSLGRFGRQRWVNAFLTVADDEGVAVTGLEAEAFRVRVGGRELTLLDAQPVAALDRPLAWAVVLERSEEMATSWTLIRRGVTEFIEEMGFRHPGVVVDYTGSAEVLAGPDANAARLAEALAETAPEPGRRRLVEGLLLGLENLDRMSASWDREGRRAMVLLTEGVEEGSRFALGVARSDLIDSNTALFVIEYGGAEAQTLEYLDRLAADTGGEAFYSALPDEIIPMLLAAADRIKHQYAVNAEFDPRRCAGQWTDLFVAVETPLGSAEAETKFTCPESVGRQFPLYWVLAGGAVFLFVAVALLDKRRTERRKRAERSAEESD